MADLADVSNDFEQLLLDQKIASRRIYAGESLKECEECGEHIPLQRRKLGGVKLCIECQTVKEKKR